MGLYSQFKTSSQKELDGIAIEFPEAQNEDGSIPTFVISRMGRSNKAYAKALEAETRPFRRQVELGTMKNEVAEEIFLRVFVGNVLKGWQHVEDQNGEPLAFNKENAIKLLTDLPDVYDRLQEEAKIAANFRDTSIDAESGN